MSGICVFHDQLCAKWKTDPIFLYSYFRFECLLSDTNPSWSVLSNHAFTVEYTLFPISAIFARALGLMAYSGYH